MNEQAQVIGAMDEQQAQAAPRAQLPDVARLTGTPERTLQHWFREYSNYRSRRGYPVQLILDVLRDHDWEGDTGALLRGLEGNGAPEQAIERHASATPEVFREQEQRLAALVLQCERLGNEILALREQQAERGAVLLREVEQVRALSTQVATLNELRGLREDLLVLRSGQQQADQTQRQALETLQHLQAAVAAQRPARRWWPFRR
jgi:hypothetical protein